MTDLLTTLKFITPFISVIVLSTIHTVNHLGKIDLEIQIMTNYQRFRSTNSIIFILSTLSTVAFMMFYDISFYETENEEMAVYAPFIETIITFLVMFTITLFAFIAMWLVDFIFTIKPKFNVYLEGKEGEWGIRRMISNKEMLLVKDSNHYTILTNWEKANFVREGIHETFLVRFIYGKTKPIWRTTFIYIFCIIFFTCVIFIIINLFKLINENNQYTLFFTFVYIILFIASFIYYQYNKVYYIQHENKNKPKK